MLNFNYNVICIFVILENRKVKNYKKLKKKTPAGFEFITNGFVINVLNHHDTLSGDTFKKKKLELYSPLLVILLSRTLYLF